ncbi:hypothetical protein BJY52DRAFT_1230821 [Lactarius psammicola]|nr:hypothetical protein BJY52DRAFT_1230821 [Lactarius psammicola]
MGTRNYLYWVLLIYISTVRITGPACWARGHDTWGVRRVGRWRALASEQAREGESCGTGATCTVSARRVFLRRGLLEAGQWHFGAHVCGVVVDRGGGRGEVGSYLLAPRVVPVVSAISPIQIRQRTVMKGEGCRVVEDKIQQPLSVGSCTPFVAFCVKGQGCRAVEDQIQQPLSAGSCAQFVAFGVKREGSRAVEDQIQQPLSVGMGAARPARVKEGGSRTPLRTRYKDAAAAGGVPSC